MIYLACPHTKCNTLQREYYYLLCCNIAAELFNRGEHVFAPIVYSHPIASRYEIPCDWQFWQTFDESLLDICDTLYVLDVPGWQESTGVQAEIQYAIDKSKRVVFIKPGDFNVELPAHS